MTCPSGRLEFDLGVELEGDVRGCIRHPEERTGGELPFRHTLVELEIGDRPHTVLLGLERAGVGEILDLAIALDAERECLVELMLQPPIDLELQAVDVGIFAELPDEERVDGGRVGAPHKFRERPEQNLVGRVILQRELVDAAKGDAQPITFALDDFVLGAEFELPCLEALADVLPEEALDDPFPPVGEAVFRLELMRLPAPLTLAWPGIDRTMLLKLELALLHVRRAHIKLGRCGHRNDHSEAHRAKRAEKPVFQWKSPCIWSRPVFFAPTCDRLSQTSMHQSAPAKNECSSSR